MNKELIDKIIDWNYGEFGTEFGDALVDLKNENIELQNRIDKTINYIEKLQEEDDIEIYREDGCWAYILYILKGDNK